MSTKPLTQAQIPFYPPSPVEKLQDYFNILNADLIKFSAETNNANLANIKNDAERIARFVKDMQATFEGAAS